MNRQEVDKSGHDWAAGPGRSTISVMLCWCDANVTSLRMNRITDEEIHILKKDKQTTVIKIQFESNQVGAVQLFSQFLF